MSMDISSKNEARLRATAQAEGVSVDAYVERLMNEREELTAIVEQAAAGCRPSLKNKHAPRLNEGSYSQSAARSLMGKPFLRDSSQSLDELERKRRAG